METLSRSESRRLYSWWWDSHNSPKNSKWLQDNLTDMDAKVKSMIKLIEEDADSFARRAEMYYKKRPELMKLVEEFYRAYRALAERYNHATGELRHAHRTIAKAFPDQVPLELVEDIPSKPLARENGPHTPEIKCPARVLFDNDEDDSEAGMRKMGSKKLDNEAQCLKKALADMEAEKEELLIKYQKCLEKLSNIEQELDNAEKDSMRLNERARSAETEVEKLKEALVYLDAEKNTGLEKILNLEAMLFKLQEKKKSETQNLKDEISRLELEKEKMLFQYNECLGKISVLENVISVMENEARLLKIQAEESENEVSELKRSLEDLNKEKDASAQQYKCCLETISKLEKDMSNAKEDVKRLNNDVLIGNVKLKASEEKHTVLEMSNLSLRAEAKNLAKKIAMKDEELSQKQDELENLQRNLQGENLRYTEIEATLETLQNVHSQSQDDQRVLAIELKNALQMLNGLEVSKNGLEEEIKQVRDENQISMANLQNEILSLREIKEKLEREVLRHVDLSNSLQQEILRLKEEIKGLNGSYRALVEQVERAGLNPKCIEASMKSLCEENAKIKQKCEEESKEKMVLLNKLENVEEHLAEKVFMENSLSDLNSELENSREKAKALQESCEFLHGEKGILVAEKASLLSQLQVITENMHSLLGKNAVLENSLSNAKVELEGLREKSKGMEEICEMLKNERSFLLTERVILVSKLENAERKLESLDKKFTGLEEKYADLEKEKKAMNCQVEELKVSLSAEKQERKISELQNESVFVGLENQIHLLKEENSWKKEYEEELDKALKAQFEISILQKFMKDMEEKNYSLIIECQKHVEASKLAEKVISELESESLEQQVEAEFLLDEIERLRLGIYQVFRALDPDCDHDEKIENEQTFVNHVLGSIEDMKNLISKHENDKEMLLVENSVLLTLLEQLESKVVEIELQKMNLEREFKIMTEKLDLAKNEKDETVEMNEQLKSDLIESDHHADFLESELGSLSVKQADLRKTYNELQEAYSELNSDTKNLLEKFSDLKEEKHRVDQHNDAVLLEMLATDSKSVILQRFGEERVMEMKLLLEDLNKQHKINSSLEKEMRILTEKLELQTAQNLLLCDAVHKLESEMQGMREYNVQMKQNLLQTEGKLLQTESKLEFAEYLRENLEKNIFELSENNSIQKNEIDSLCTVNTNLESELGLLREEKSINEQILNLKLQAKNGEYELFEAEAATFYFDLQISSIHEVLYKNKLQEVTGVCMNLENENASKTSEIEQMKRKICVMEGEINGLRSQLSAYAPIVAALRDDMTLLEHNAVLHAKLKAARNQEPELSEVAADPRTSTSEILEEDQSLLSLQNLHARIKAVGKMMEGVNKPASQRRRSSNSSKTKQESTVVATEQLKPRRFLGRDNNKKKAHANEETPKLQKIKTKATEVWNGMRMKDIPLDQISNLKKGNVGRADQMLELWEIGEDGKRIQTIGESLRTSSKMTKKDIIYDEFQNVNRNSSPPSTDSDMEKELGVDMLEVSTKLSEANKEVNKRRLLERLTSDAQKLENLQTNLEILNTKLETNKKSKKGKNVDFETVQEQLVEAEETIVDLVDMNGQLVRKLQECPSPEGRVSPRRRKVVEQARKGSERIGRLQLELQKLQFIVMKMEDEKKNKGRIKFFRSKSVVLRDYIYNGKRNSPTRKKGPTCGCFRPSTSRNGLSSS
ncbi:hypothetical protein BUALT_Bualt14G0097600 [Buddleja alternifolia]|uniref:NAB domain-containing protein n=1 Tax=Buddleja alternifolia TaxID=168488 RepID=A0AAV6WPU4_9LAMI|nr:hypothetical protein BUALT_Bualt14G0097600 [Buddleja alternifolia]